MDDIGSAESGAGKPQLEAEQEEDDPRPTADVEDTFLWHPPVVKATVLNLIHQLRIR